MMLRNIAAVCMIVVLSSLCLVGCSDNNQQAPPAEEVKTAEEYKAEAEKEITEENVADELDKLEQEIQLEAGQ
jgi:PBP1b-binding outer membrane lipoprotein LpoB